MHIFVTQFLQLLLHYGENEKYLTNTDIQTFKAIVFCFFISWRENKIFPSYSGNMEILSTCATHKSYLKILEGFSKAFEHKYLHRSQ